MDYRTPIVDLMQLLKKAKGFVGYHGTAAWPAKFMKVPSVLFTDGGRLSRKSFPSAYINVKKNLFSDINDIEKCFELAQQRIDINDELYEGYMPGTRFREHLQYEF